MFVTDRRTADRLLEFNGPLTVWTVDGAVAKSRENFFSALAAALRFPDYFGRNWDATYDCLTDLAGGDVSPAVLLITDGAQFLDGMSCEWNVAQRVLSAAAAFWEKLERRLLIILVEDHALPEMRVLPARCLDEVLSR